MFTKKVFLTTICFCFLSFFYSPTVYSNTPPDNIKLNTPEYKTHTKGLVIFSHKKHSSDYNIGCGECHHDNDGNPLKLKLGDDVDRCVFCHTETGKKLKEEKLAKKEAIKKYHKIALHNNCKGCHKKFNKKNNLKKGDFGAAPQDCKECHPSKNKD